MSDKILAFTLMCRKCKYCLISAASAHRKQPVNDYAPAKNSNNLKKRR